MKRSIKLQLLVIKPGVKALIPIFLLLLMAALLTGCASASAGNQPAQVRVAQMLPVGVDVRISPVSPQGTQAELTNLAFKQITDYQSFKPGRYEVEVRADDRVLKRITYGFGVNGAYTLTLFGLMPGPETPAGNSFWANLKWMLGGSEEITANGYLPQVRLLNDTVSGNSHHAYARLVHTAPGAVGLTAKAVSSAPVKVAEGLGYAAVSDVASLTPGAQQLTISLQNSPVALLNRPLEIESGTLATLFVTGGVAEEAPLTVVVANNSIAPVGSQSLSSAESGADSSP